FTAPATTDTDTLSLHDALPIFTNATPLRKEDDPPSDRHSPLAASQLTRRNFNLDPSGRPAYYSKGYRSSRCCVLMSGRDYNRRRSEEHTSELQSRENLVCRLLL